MTSSGGSPAGIDLVVYGATAGGVAAATAAARQGLRVVLADPTQHVGGMVSGGLSRSDVERQEPLIGGLARELFARIGRHYGSSSSSEAVGHQVAWRFEPKVAERIMREWLDEAGVTLEPAWQLARVERLGDRIRELVADDGSRLAASCFVDASYEGDLLAAAGVSYAVVGKDGRATQSRWPEGSSCSPIRISSVCRSQHWLRTVACCRTCSHTRQSGRWDTATARCSRTATGSA